MAVSTTHPRDESDASHLHRRRQVAVLIGAASKATLPAAALAARDCSVGLTVVRAFDPYTNFAAVVPPAVRFVDPPLSRCRSWTDEGRGQVTWPARIGGTSVAHVALRFGGGASDRSPPAGEEPYLQSHTLLPARFVRGPGLGAR